MPDPKDTDSPFSNVTLKGGRGRSYHVPQTSEDVHEWMRQRGIDEVECVVPDIVGIARGKAMPASKFSGLSPTYLPSSIFFQTITGNYIEMEDRQDFMMERDIQLVPDLSTLRAVPWANDPTMQVIHDLYDLDGNLVELAPRNVLRRVMGGFETMGWKPVVAPELEFYLTKRNTDPDYPLEPPVGRSGRQSVGRQAYSIAAVDEYDRVIEDIYDFADAQGLEIDTVIQEGGAGQLEINLIHGDPVDLADQIFVFKRLIREAAFRHDCYATFMAKPMDNEPGSAMHIHQSLVDAKTGRNVFSNEDGTASELFYEFLGGQQKYLPDAMSIFAPYVNSYRRLLAGDSAPINLEWSIDNRSVGLRIPNSGPEARRIENRLVGADTNPYLAIAASLACGLLGIMNKDKPKPQLQHHAHHMPFSLPRSVHHSLGRLEKNTQLHDLLGPDFVNVYSKIKLDESEEFNQVISPWEREHLLLTV
ncbi:glutamine synthetase [Cohaesibacter sp. ES.047]|uniref:glutamine synthetase family protein n=1 Tax=Cohaesibacter sp. ES.047 TaxID=1798205 RepID=UPI000BB807AD|nr:glutamine synthetase family protein [Cohaesibacter sp. ES.047]SNY90183.1 glutamine synthetase [Cohaesibacter sp. ES.047]